MSKIKCNRCGKEFAFGNRPDGIPNGVGFIMRNGREYNICAECVIEAGKNPKVADEIKRELEK